MQSISSTGGGKSFFITCAHCAQVCLQKQIKISFHYYHKQAAVMQLEVIG